MKILLLMVGKTDDKYLNEGISIYLNRLVHYTSFESKAIPDVRKGRTLSEAQQKAWEGDQLLASVVPSDLVVLLDDKGREYTSRGFSDWIEKQMMAGTKRLVFVIGGPYGFSSSVYERANAKLSLSRMTFSHQMVRLIFVEQLYRAFSIHRGEPYHHE